MDKQNYLEAQRERTGCGTTDPNVLCTSETCDWYIRNKQYSNCFLVYRYYIQDTSHTLQEVAALMEISHTTVKQIETQALNKIRELVASGEITLQDIGLILNTKN